MISTRAHVAFILLVTMAAGCRRHGRTTAQQPGYSPQPAPTGYGQAPSPAYDPAQPAYAPPPTQPTGIATPQSAGGGCEAACQHYLTCKRLNEPILNQECVIKCTQANFAPQDLAGYLRTDCATAISIVEGTQGAGATPSTGKDCRGCVWDGSSCIWLSSGNWGAGPYSGAASSCDPACCPGH